jgi:hypothetical protein
MQNEGEEEVVGEGCVCVCAACRERERGENEEGDENVQNVRVDE